MDETNPAIDQLAELEEDTNIPKNIKVKIRAIIDILKPEEEVSIKVNKALSELDDMSNDPNLDSYTRTRMWNVVSILEKINHH
ncbi:MAG TPA: UPF0147 family protein [Candidatus Nanoarchaeia archaeon]|nr:UPF0147 family protein [Candidatus Nanoarchaeia archaeon]